MHQSSSGHVGVSSAVLLEGGEKDLEVSGHIGIPATNI